MQLFLARHGQAEHQTLGVLGGRGPFPLTPRGRDQAAALGRRLREVLPLTAVYASPVTRARQTAEIAMETVGPPSLAIAQVDGLAEQDWGLITGMALTEVRQRCPGLFEHWNPPPDSGGETRLDLWTRVASAVGAIVAAHAEGDRVLLVSHGGAIHAAVTHLMGMGPATDLAFLAAPASLCGFELKGGRTRLLFLNETGYLGDLRD